LWQSAILINNGNPELGREYIDRLLALVNDIDALYAEYDWPSCKEDDPFGWCRAVFIGTLARSLHHGLPAVKEGMKEIRAILTKSRKRFTKKGSPTGTIDLMLERLSEVDTSSLNSFYSTVERISILKGFKQEELPEGQYAPIQFPGARMNNDGTFYFYLIGSNYTNVWDYADELMKASRKEVF